MFEYQRPDGKVIAVEESLQWDEFKLMALDSCPLGHEPTIDVYIQAWTYTEPPLPGSWMAVEETQAGARHDETQWHSGLFQCVGSDGLGAATYLQACLCPCVLSAEIAQAFGEDWWSGCLGGGLGSACLRRQHVRSKYGIDGSDAADCAVTTCCAPCSLCQMVAHVRRYKHVRDAGNQSWPVGILDCSQPGFLRRCCWTTSCLCCALGANRSRLGSQQPMCPILAGQEPGCFWSGCSSWQCGMLCGVCGCVLGLMACSQMVCLAFQSRSQTRAALGIDGGLCSDLLAVLCCLPCALVQV